MLVRATAQETVKGRHMSMPMGHTQTHTHTSRTVIRLFVDVSAVVETIQSITEEIEEIEIFDSSCEGMFGA